MECLTAQRSDTRLHAPIYDPSMSYQDNFDRGPFGEFANDVRIEQAGKPQHKFLGHPVFAPFGVPAGPLLNGKFVKAALDKGFDIPVYKTVRTRRVLCHAWPNVLAVEVEGDLTLDKTRLVANDNYVEPLSITNSFGVPSFDPDFWQPDLADVAAYAGPGQVVVGSYQGTKSERGGAADYIADFVLGARLMRETGVKIVEVNLSCPNEGTSALLCFDVERSREVVEAIKNELGEIPLLIKVAYFRDDATVEQLVRAVSGAVSGIVAINTISAEIVDEHGQQALPGEGRLRSGVCGRSIKWAGLEMTQRLRRVREVVGKEFSIIGCGGVSDAADFDEYRQAGADAVMAATGMMWNPQLALQLSEMHMSSEVAEAMVAIGAVGFRLNDPVTFKSGIQSPVYCDNRKFPFWPEQWEKVIRGFAGLVHEKGITCDVVGGIEAAGIPHSAALGFAMSKPSIFIRKEAKSHGAKKRVEGGEVAGKSVVLIEDLVTTGGSSLSAVEALREEGAVVKDCLCIISYGFPEARESFEHAGVRLHALTNFDAVLAVALRQKTIDEAGVEVVRTWMSNPRGWKALEK